ncbi:hypothetical protein [Paenibacillus curdlanolyticus]|nr:hypothetical protein [Paenibacillus curdlanolyticus]
MEDLISFLLHNIYIVVVVVGFLFSMLNKSNKSKGRNRRMPDFGNGGDQPSGQPARTGRVQRSDESDPRPTMAQPLAEPRPQQRQPAPAEAYEAPAAVSAGVRAAEPVQRVGARSERPSRLSTAADSSQPPLASRERQNELKPTAETLRQAVLWSEILGPPRAKRPFRR